jgi:3-dehydroquinate synthase
VRRLVCPLDPPYPILVGSSREAGMWTEVARLREERGLEGPAFLLTDAVVGPLHARGVRDALAGVGLEPALHEIPPGEGSKTAATLEAVCRAMARAGLTRRGLLVALGGGVVGDVGGLAAALYMRGIPWIAAPTTLLAQVDSSIGGKVAVDLPEGKNLLGAFHQPAAVLTDPGWLATLPQREFRAGLAEVLKTALVGDSELYRRLLEAGPEVLERPAGLLEEILVRCIQVKARVVAEDERDWGRRHILNLGHTFGHALEAATGYAAYRHGEAVAVGLVAALWLSRRLGLLEAAVLRDVEGLLRAWGLPTRAPGVAPIALEESMERDKKFRAGGWVFVLLEGPGRPVLRRDPPRDLVREALGRMTAGEGT